MKAQKIITACLPGQVPCRIILALCTLAFVDPVVANPTERSAATSWQTIYKNQEELFSLDGYRLLRYRSPTPANAEGAETLDTPRLKALLDSKTPPALLNVQPIRWQQGHFLQQEPFMQIPGSHWTPNVGMGELDEGWSEYFQYHLKKLTNNQKTAAVVLYCRADCWMSWNAVKRAAGWGYTNLYWYREGVDGWRDSGYRLDVGEPQPYPIRK